ncbi:hypothetical protein M407DRAFT_208728 [Tulasnella calospora MUT 4182]|uniref:Protein kinase domain-containing protein n=1 Tax=Tulasnella calospora MUT 4182 TaxID=1051891 RepID=A0A0C3PMP4_9AGAM|nr:hypothetical protein M407DRAFT_208728 [Tulasnella calospora MUT 4182]
MTRRLFRETDAWSAVIHHNVVPLIGFTITPCFSVISPWYKYGHIRSYILSHPDCDRLKLVHGIAKGLAYLHSQKPAIIHGNIRSDNILINDQGDPLISDFGSATVTRSNTLYEDYDHRMNGASRWMAPELLLNPNEVQSGSTDVYSFGSVALEVMISELPHSGLPDSRIPVALLSPDAQPFDDWERYPQLPEAIKQVILKCWSRRPGKRPSMEEVDVVFATLAPNGPG